MESRIQLLPAALADQIAAGEVVERPASVVKELVENALDAGARRVEVEIERGGLARICVADDGEGMSPSDAHLCLRRHATSKLRAADELFQLGSFGFRGEALPSIASICTMLLTTRRAEATAGYQLRVRAGATEEAREVGAPPGTRIEVADLFANVPARLKFQKTSAVEAGHVLEAVTRLSLGEPGAHLRLRVDGRAVLDLPPHHSLSERAIAVMRRIAPGARVATVAHVEGPIAVEVHVAAPEAAVQSARRVHLLVNRRAIRDRGLIASVQIAFGELLPRGRHPLAVIAIQLPGADVDVNVHPQKLEVRLARPGEVYAAVRHAVARAVADAGFVAAAEAQRRVETSYPTEDEDESLSARDGDRLDDLIQDDLHRGPERGRAYELVRALAGDDAARVEAGELDVAAAPRIAARFVGGLPSGYLLFRDPAGLLILDQHATSALLIDQAGAADVAASSSALRERELAAALADGGPDEARARAATLAAITPSAELDGEAATKLLDGLRALAAEGRIESIEQARWRGRRALIRVPLSELWRRLEA